jgi:hypothetical protein
MKKLQSSLIFLVPLLGFVFILVGLNGYQYLRIRTDIATGIVSAIGATEKEEMQSYFSGIDARLGLVREWGANDVLVDGDIISLNKKFIPFLNQQEAISAILVANDLGQEYFLTKGTGHYLTRVSASTNKGNILHFQEWSTADTPGRSWQENSDYDPRKRSWFPNLPGDDKVHWSKVYPFFHTKELGITASVSWATPDSQSNRTIFAIDIPLSDLKGILTKRSADRPGLLFLVGRDGNLFIAGTKDEQNTKIGITSEEANVLRTSLIKQWQETGSAEGELIKMKNGGQQWLAVFQKLDQNNQMFWLGFAASENDLLGQIDKEIYMVDFFDLSIAVTGALLILLFMAKRGLLRQSVSSQPEPLVRLREYISQGEGPKVEFKSTIRTNLQTGKRGKEIEFAWLKAVTAFLNSDGGTLLLGVADSGEICGIEADEFENSDRCLLHVKNLLNQHIGAEFSSYIFTTILDCSEGSAVMLECRPAGAAVFLKIGKNEEFYVRSGPSSTKLSPSQTLSYMAEKKS